MNMDPNSWNMQNINPSSLWVLEIFIGVVGVVLLNIGLKLLLKAARMQAPSHVGEWKHRIEHIFLLPLQIILVDVAFVFVLSILGQRFQFAAFLSVIKPLRDAVVVLCLAWMGLRWKKEVLHDAHKKVSQAHATLLPMLSKVATIFICVLSLLLILQIFSLDIMPLLAFGGIGAAAIGFAAKDVISNFFGGLMLSITRPFVLGDDIIYAEKGIEGKVEEVGWYLTCVRDKDKRPVYLPNSLFSSALVINTSRMSHRRIVETLQFTYGDFDKVDAIAAGIREMLLKHPLIDHTQYVMVNIESLSDYFIGVKMEAYTTVTKLDEYNRARHVVLSAAYEIIYKQGAETATPMLAVQMAKQ